MGSWDPQHHYRLQIRPPVSTISAIQGGHPPRQPQSPNHVGTGRLGEGPVQQGSNHSSSRHTGRVCQHSLPGSQARRIMEDSNQSEIAEQICCSPSLQNGVNQDCQRIDPGRGLDGKTGSKGCIPGHTHPRTTSEIPSVQVGLPDMTLPFGLNSAPHTFTKLMKPVVAVIRRLAVRLILYLDDMLIAARTTEEVRRHLATALELLVALGFIINIKKSVFKLTQNLEFLGFQLNSLSMTISLPKDKLHAIRKAARRLQERKKCSVRDLAHLLGMMVAAHPAILPAPLHYRNLELGKTKSYVRDASKISILLRLDNITAISFINRMGGTHSKTLSELATEIWNWCIERQIMIHAEHLPGVENIQADWQSRHLTDSSDWKLHLQAFQVIEDKLGPFSIDLFASRTNHQLPTYCSWKPDPAAMAIDGLSIPWRRHHPYMFPPFSLIPRCLEKLEMEKVQAVLIAPVWPNQVWYPRLLESLIGQPLILPPVQDILTDPDEHCHPLVMECHLPLAAWPISGDHARHRDFLTELSASSGAPGDNLLRQHIHQLGDCGPAGVLNGTSIPFQPL